MSEETETPEAEDTELYHYDDGTHLDFPYYGGQTQADIQRYLQLKATVEGMIERGEPVYAQILDDRRAGSVGKVTKIEFPYREAQKGTGYGWYNRDTPAYLGVSGIEIEWDGRKNKVRPIPGEVELLLNWSGGTQWHWNPGVPKAKEPQVDAFDHLGHKIEAGQFVCFVHRRYGNISMKFGTVTRITPKGSVYVKTLKLRDGERAGEELKALDMDDIVICNDKLMGRLMMARLAAD